MSWQDLIAQVHGFDVQPSGTITVTERISLSVDWEGEPEDFECPPVFEPLRPQYKDRALALIDELRKRNVPIPIVEKRDRTVDFLYGKWALVQAGLESNFRWFNMHTLERYRTEAEAVRAVIKHLMKLWLDATAERPENWQIRSIATYGFVQMYIPVPLERRNEIWNVLEKLVEADVPCPIRINNTTIGHVKIVWSNDRFLLTNGVLNKPYTWYWCEPNELPKCVSVDRVVKLVQQRLQVRSE